MPGRRWAAVACVGLAGLFAACSGSQSSEPTVAVTDPLRPNECAEADPVLLVDQIDEAVAAVEDQLGGPQRYFEINATTVVVNLFVAGEGDLVTPFAFAADGLTSQDPVSGATGNTFAAEAIEFDPTRVTSCVTAELVTSTQEVFIVLGGPDGAVSYSLLTRSTEGGQLLVSVDADGSVLAVDPVS